ncbi:hypothetical protein ES705_34465 [subsurface metagenome]
MSDQSKKREEEEAKKYPEINTGLEKLNEAGEWVIGKDKEPFTAYPRGFVYSGIIGVLNGKTSKLLSVICSFTGRFRGTTIKDETIIKYANVCQNTLSKALNELEFYHVISRHLLPGGSKTKRRRMINIIRWDTARARLIKEKKIKLGLDNKVVFVIPNPFMK